MNSDEEDSYDSPDIKRRGASVDDFLKGSELGKQPHCCHGDEYHTESSRGSDLSDIMEEDEEELYSEMQLEDGGRRRPSGTSHNALKVSGPWSPASSARPGAPVPCLFAGAAVAPTGLVLLGEAHGLQSASSSWLSLCSGISPTS